MSRSRTKFRNQNGTVLMGEKEDFLVLFSGYEIKHFELRLFICHEHYSFRMMFLINEKSRTGKRFFRQSTR